MTPTTLLTIAGNALTAFSENILRASANLFDHFNQGPSPFDGGDLESVGLPLPPKIPVIATKTAEMVIERAVSIDTIVIPCSQNKVIILFGKSSTSLLRTFPMVCLMVPLIVSLYSCLYSSEYLGSIFIPFNFFYVAINF